MRPVPARERRAAPRGRQALWWADLSCRGCDRTSCPHWTCLPSLEPARAAGLVLEHLERYGS